MCSLTECPCGDRSFRSIHETAAVSMGLETRPTSERAPCLAVRCSPDLERPMRDFFKQMYAFFILMMDCRGNCSLGWRQSVLCYWNNWFSWFSKPATRRLLQLREREMIVWIWTTLLTSNVSFRITDTTNINNSHNTCNIRSKIQSSLYVFWGSFRTWTFSRESSIFFPLKYDYFLWKQLYF